MPFIFVIFLTIISCGKREHPEVYNGPTKWQHLPVSISTETGISSSQDQYLSLAIKMWEDATGKNLIGINGEKLTKNKPFILNDVEVDGINGVYLISDWKASGYSENTLGYSRTFRNNGTIFTGDIFFNNENFFWTSQSLTRRRAADLAMVAVHEVGHFLGLPHVSEEDDPNSIMNPTLSLTSRFSDISLSETDVQSIQNRYGCEGATCKIKGSSKEFVGEVRHRQFANCMKKHDSLSLIRVESV